MNKLTPILVVAFIFLTAFTVKETANVKTFSITEMENLTSKSMTDFETNVLTKGYSLQSHLSSETTKLYWSDAKRTNMQSDQITRTAKPEINTIINFSTTNKQSYLDFKTAIKTKGYKFTHQEDISLGDDVNCTWFYYSNNKYEVILYSYTLKVNGITWYNHQVYQK